MSKEIDLLSLTNDGVHFAETKNGVLRVINSLTGKIVAIQNLSFSDPGVTAPDDFVSVLLPTGATVMVQKGLEKYALDAVKSPELQPYLVDIICQKIVESGKGLSLICEEDGMPSYGTLCKWRRKHAWVAQALADARIDRAERMRDLAVKTAEESLNPEDSIDADKLKVDTYKWAAGVDDSKFSPKAKVEANINVPTQLIVVTGIDRSPEVPETKERDVSQNKNSGEKADGKDSTKA